MSYLVTLDYVSVYSSIQINWSSGTFYLTFDSETAKTVAGMHSTTTNTGRLIAVNAGWYSLSGTWASYTDNTTYQVVVVVRKNGSTIISQSSTLTWGIAATGSQYGNGGPCYPALYAEFHLNAGDYVEVGMTPNGASGGFQAMEAGTGSGTITLRKVSN